MIPWTLFDLWRLGTTVNFGVHICYLAQKVHTCSLFFYTLFIAFCFLFSFSVGRMRWEKPPTLHCKMSIHQSASVFIQLCSKIPKLPQQSVFLQGHSISWSEVWGLLCLLEMATHNCETMPVSFLVNEQGGGHLLF
ncbi:hypothetical protein M431DRAFT_181512 [Trichoderma harzianum CBS 226.95]|uniref:Uncharacterized protein n=1 Tax=Trichoderma harzianum CBS 226.95 TaxID=983964 RepID=A0A2T4ATZ3_TRIHA|nr:hypothetical protein M431DRAFT_181512 [Trichoderma harzianum CBS 226.95]PTB60448.1 hypothetical protein M431DRAFT_181512 [Trichoderma harzianum CBS 226.95]